MLDRAVDPPLRSGWLLGQRQSSALFFAGAGIDMEAIGRVTVTGQTKIKMDKPASTLIPATLPQCNSAAFQSVSSGPRRLASASTTTMWLDASSATYSGLNASSLRCQMPYLRVLRRCMMYMTCMNVFLQFMREGTTSVALERCVR